MRPVCDPLNAQVSNDNSALRGLLVFQLQGNCYIHLPLNNLFKQLHKTILFSLHEKFQLVLNHPTLLPGS